MNNDAKWGILDNYLSKFADSSFIRIYSDGSVSLAAYIDGKQISFDGDYEIVYTCIRCLYQESVR